MSNVTVHSSLLSTVRVHVDMSGNEGRPVILIHGWPLSGVAFQDQVAPLVEAGLRSIRYDRRGFGHSDKPASGYDYDTLSDDLAALITELDLHDVSLVGFSMGGGEVARYVGRHGEERLHSVVFASAVPPYLAKTGDNPEGPLDSAQAAAMAQQLTDDRDAFFDGFTTQFFSADGDLKVTEQQRQDALALCAQADEHAALACMNSWATTDFRDDLTRITVPTLVIHGSADAIVPFEASGRRTHAAIAHSELVVLDGAPHGCNVSHQAEFNAALVEFLSR